MFPIMILGSFMALGIGPAIRLCIGTILDYRTIHITHFFGDQAFMFLSAFISVHSIGMTVIWSEFHGIIIAHTTTMIVMKLCDTSTLAAGHITRATVVVFRIAV